MSAAGVRRRGLGSTAVTVGLVLVASACADKGADSGLGSPPDVTGRYNVVVQGTTGCEGEQQSIAGWAQGPLTIAGSASALAFDFGDDMVLTGFVDGTGEVRFSETLPYGGAELLITSEAIWREDGAGSTLQGELSVVVDEDGLETTNCTIDGPYVATELVGVTDRR